MAHPLTRRRFLSVIASAAAIPVIRPALALARNRNKTRKMNVLFIAVDDLRPELGCYGREHIISPNIDRLAKEGLLFERTYCQQAVCAPSRISIMTGARPDTTTVYDLNTPLRKAMPDVLSLPEHFKNHGYETLSIGKIYHHSRDDAQGWTTEPYRAGTFPKGAWKGRGYLSKEAIAQMEEYNKANPKMKGRGPAFDAADGGREWIVLPDHLQGVLIPFLENQGYVALGTCARWTGVLAWRGTKLGHHVAVWDGLGIGT